MPFSQFFRELLYVGAATTVLILLGSLFTPLKETTAFAFGTLFFFIPAALILYSISERIKKSENKNLFTSFILAFGFGKMLLAIIGLLIYYRTAQPMSNLILIPFFIIYFIFMIFETYVLINLGKVKTR